MTVARLSRGFPSSGNVEAGTTQRPERDSSFHEETTKVSERILEVEELRNRNLATPVAPDEAILITLDATDYNHLIQDSPGFVEKMIRARRCTDIACMIKNMSRGTSVVVTHRHDSAEMKTNQTTKHNADGSIEKNKLTTNTVLQTQTNITINNPKDTFFGNEFDDFD